MAAAPTVHVSSRSAYHGPDPQIARHQLELLTSMYRQWGPNEFAARAFWIIRKNPEEGERDLLPQDNRFWNRRLVPFVQNRIQRDLVDKIIVGGSKRNIILKPRQVGLTTWIIIMRLLMPVVLEPGSGSMLISQNAEYAAAHFGMLKLAYKHFMEADPYDNEKNDWAIGLRQHLLHIAYSNRRELIFDQIDSRVRCASAEVEETGQGFCVSPKVWMQMADARFIRYGQIVKGDSVIGSDGKPVVVERVFTIKAKDHPYRGVAYKVVPRALGKLFTFTVAPNHPLMTQRGMLETKDILVGDYLAYPKRGLSESMSMTRLPNIKRQYRNRVGVLYEKGSKCRFQDKRIALDRDFGLVCGMYLGDGFSSQRFVGIKMMNARKRTYAAKRVVERMKGIVESPSVGEDKILLAGTVFATWIRSNFGWAKTKNVPTWVFDAPREFILGVLEGWIVADGYWPTGRKYIEAYGSNSKIVLPMKEIAIALGVGIPYLNYENGRRKRVIICGVEASSCGKKFTMSFYAEAYENLVQMLGLKRKVAVNKHLWRKSQWQDENYVYIRIDAIKKTMVKEFKDITVKSKDHLYCLPYVLTHNTIQHLACTEVSRWEGKPEETLANAKEAIPEDGTMEIECTPNGAGGYFFEEWNRSTNVANPKREFMPHFHPWWWQDEYRRKPAVGMNELSEEERSLVVAQGLDGEQVAWRREKKESLRHNFAEKYAEDDISCFILSGNAFFEKEILNLRYKELQSYTPVQTFNKFVVFQKPIKHRRYIIGCDVATGLPVTSQNPDFSAAVVIDQETGDEVAAYRAHVLPEELANDMEDLGHMYNNAEIAIERNNEGGTVIMALKIANQYGNIYTHKDWWKRDWQNTRFIEGFMTTLKTRPIALNRIRWIVAKNPELIHDIIFIGEAISFVFNETNGKPEAVKGAHDDLVFANAIAYVVRQIRGGYITPEQLRGESYGATPQEYASEEELDDPTKQGPQEYVDS